MAVAGLATFALFATALIEALVPQTALIGLRLLLGGAALLFASASLHPGESAHLGRTMRPLLLSAIPAAWLLIQALPLPFAANPVWASAAEALPHGAWGHITVDVQATVFALLGLVLAAVVSLAMAAQTLDRGRAETALVALCAAAILLPACNAAAALLGVPESSASQSAAMNCFVLAVLLTTACGTLAFERYETRHAGHARPRARLIAAEAACAAIVVCCSTVAWLIGGTTYLVAAAAGLWIFASIVTARRFGWGAWFVAGSFAILTFVVLSIETNGFGLPQGSPAPVPTLDIEHQMLRDSPWVGTGGGTSLVFSKLYRTLDDQTAFASSSAALKAMIEWGTPALWVLAILTCGLEIVMVRDALRRGRDSVYPILGAALLPTILILMFASDGLLEWNVVAVGAGSLGLALCQRQSRTLVR